MHWIQCRIWFCAWKWHLLIKDWDFIDKSSRFYLVLVAHVYVQIFRYRQDEADIVYVIYFFRTRRISAPPSCVTIDCLPYFLSISPKNIRRLEVFCCFQGVYKRNNGLKWVNYENRNNNVIISTFCSKKTLFNNFRIIIFGILHAFFLLKFFI